MTDSSALVEHFFRHEYGRLVAALTRSLGVRQLELAEDAVQMAMWRALQHWSRRGVPEAPAAWLYRTARNLALDAIRRDATFQRMREEIAVEDIAPDHASGGMDDVVSDESLRLLFLCCHPSIPAESQVALALKIVGGFSVPEIASGLLASVANIEKRITRAKARLREVGQELTGLTIETMEQRHDAVLLVLYLMFNEGFSASHGESALKRDVCDEAIRLTRMLVSHPSMGQAPATAALLALMLMHSARFTTRVDADECVVLLGDQDRTAWNWPQVREAMDWMLTAARGDNLSRYHIEVAIAWEHCRASGLDATDWPRVAQLYQLLIQVAPSPMVRLNATIAQAYAYRTIENAPQVLQQAIDQLLAMPAKDRQQLRPWWDCTMAHLLECCGQADRARWHWRDALTLAGCSASRKLIEKRLHSAESNQ